MTKSRFIFLTVATTILLTAFYLCCGVFVVQPLSDAADGSTFVYWRLGTDLPFIASADGLLLKQAGTEQAAKKQAGKKKPGKNTADSITLEARGEKLSATSDVILMRRLVKLPYSRQLYLLSTDGVDLDRPLASEAATTP